MLEQPIAVLGEWKHSYQISNLAPGTHQTLFSSHAEQQKKTKSPTHNPCSIEKLVVHFQFPDFLHQCMPIIVDEGCASNN